MATWMVHLRIAENLLKNYDLHETEFLAGNIGPDSGIPNKNWTSYNPPKKVTHWFIETNGLIPQIDAESFYEKYLKDQLQMIEEKKLSFLLGYYVHLLTDIEWSIMHKSKQDNNPEYNERIINDKNFIWEVKQDWYGLDFEYICQNEDNIFNSKFTGIKDMINYVDYFPEDAFNIQIKYIQDFYKNKSAEFIPTGRYLTTLEMDRFVEATSHFINDKLKKLL